MNFGLARSSASLEDVYLKTDERSILHYYLGISSLPCVMQSPLREDNRPSFGVYISPTNSRIYWKDFSTHESGGVIDLMSKIWNLDFNSTIQKIYKDIPNFSADSNIDCTIDKHHSNKIVYSSVVDLKCKVRPWKKYDLDYWDSQGVSLPWLKFGDIYPISHIIIIRPDSTAVIPAEKYAYAYVERKDGKVSLKIYQPFSKTHKWSNKHDSSVWDLWTQLPEKGDNLIITSSRKDALCIWENTGIPSCSLQAESYLPKEHVVEELKERFKNIYVLYDNDFQAKENHGRLLGKSMANQFGLKQIEIPNEYLSKDTSDLCKNHGREVVYSVILKLINK